MKIYENLGKSKRLQEMLNAFKNKIGDKSFNPRIANLSFYPDDNFHFNAKDRYGDNFMKTNAYTDYNRETLTYNHIDIFIIFNTDYLSDVSINNYTEVYNTATFIHEIIHAEMFKYLWENGKFKNNELDKSAFIELLNNKDGQLINKFSKIIDKDHNIMASVYLETFINMMRDIYPNMTYEEAEAFVWDGLEGSEAYKNRLKNKDKLKKNKENAEKKYPERCYSF